MRGSNNSTQETYHLFTYTVPQKLTGVVVFTDERVSGEECAQRPALLKFKKSAVTENHLPDASGQAFQTRGGTSMPHTIELVTETCHDARLYFLLMGLEASFDKGSAGVRQFVSHRGLAYTTRPLSCQRKQSRLEPIASFCPFLVVKMQAKGDRP